MHEFALALNQLMVMKSKAKRQGWTHVKKLRIGILSMVTTESLRLAFELVSKGPIAENVGIDVEEEEPQIVGRCYGTHLSRLEVSSGTNVAIVSMRTAG